MKIAHIIICPNVYRNKVYRIILVEEDHKFRPLIVFHIGKLLEKIRDRKPSKVGGIRLASAVDKVTLPTRAVRAVLA